MRSDFTRRIAKWGTRLGTFDIRYKLRNFIKGQVLADFVAEFTPALGASVGICQLTVKRYQVYVDVASNIRGLGVGIVMVSPEGLRLESHSDWVFALQTMKPNMKPSLLDFE